MVAAVAEKLRIRNSDDLMLSWLRDGLNKALKILAQEIDFAWK